MSRQINADPDTGATMIDEINGQLDNIYAQSFLTLTVTGGTVDDIECDVTPAMTGAITAGMKFAIVMPGQNTGAMTLKIGALAAVSLMNDDGAEMTAGQTTAARLEFLYFDGTVVRVANVVGKTPIFRHVVFTANGTWTNDLPADALVMIETWGGGAGGSTIADGSGAGAGGYAARWMRAGDISSSVAATVALQALAGATGGDSSFGSYLTGYGGGKGNDWNPGSGRGGGGGGGGNTSKGGGGKDGLAGVASGDGGEGGGPMKAPGGIGEPVTGGGAGGDGIGSPTGGSGGGASVNTSNLPGNGAPSTDGGGGGGGGGTHPTGPGNGGDSIDGGGGGAGAGTGSKGGISLRAGDGGDYGADGAAPSGGGGANGGKGARGEIRLTIMG